MKNNHYFKDFTWKGNLIFYPKKANDKTSLVAYNFKERRLTCIGKVDQRFDEFAFNKSIEYKDTVYFVVVDNRDDGDVKLKVGKLYQTSQQEEVNFEKIIDHLIPQSIIFIENILLFIKDDILCICILDIGMLFSFDLQDQQAKLQQHRSDVFLNIQNSGIIDFVYCFNNPNLYFISGGFIYEIDSTDITNMEIKSKESFEGIEKIWSRARAVVLNGKIYHHSWSKDFIYQIDLETKATKRFPLSGILPLSSLQFAGRKLFITSENEIRFYGVMLSNENLFLEITFDDENDTN